MSLETEALSWASLLTGKEERMPRGIGGRSSQVPPFFFSKARNYLPGERGKRFSCTQSKGQQDFTDLWEHLGPRLPDCPEAVLQMQSWFLRLKEFHTGL